jgi:hypothetical protein
LKKYQFIEDGEDGGNGSMMEVSTLRRKLFMKQPASPESPEDFGNSFEVSLSPPPGSPQIAGGDKYSPLPQNESYGSDMFGELSPIRKCSSPQIHSNDVSMISDFGHETPSRGFYRKKKGKNLSESFLSLQHEFEEKENNQPIKDTKKFTRFDSGFSADELSSDMQF